MAKLQLSKSLIHGIECKSTKKLCTVCVHTILYFLNFSPTKMRDVHIYFDLETTGLDPRTSEIVQIGAVHENGSEFMKYIIPNGDIDEEASNVNGITKEDDGLYKNEEFIEDAANPYDGLKEFLDWIDANNQDRDKVILIGHNSVRFDAPILINNIINYDVLEIQDLGRTIWGFSDTLKHFRNQFEFRTNTQKWLMQEFGMQDQQTHDALQDTYDLMELVDRAADRLQIRPRDFVACYTILIWNELAMEIANNRKRFVGDLTNISLLKNLS